MCYDVHDNMSSSPCENVPLLSHSPSCPSVQDVVSAALAIDQWRKGAFPADEILLGVPSYGYVPSRALLRLSQRHRLVGENAQSRRGTIGLCAIVVVAPRLCINAIKIKWELVEYECGACGAVSGSRHT